MLTCPSCGRSSAADAAFCAGCGSPLGATALAREVRKTVTALFCDLVGSTTLGETHDPEVLRPLLHAYFTEIRAAVERHGGRVEKFIGDAVSAVFGLPIAHEDDALRAVRAGLEMQRGIAALSGRSPITLECRVGIATGEVLVPARGEPLIGEAMNTAARLQATAEPGSVVIGESTWSLVSGVVTADPLEPLELKGMSERVRAYAVRGVGPRGAVAETPLVGRSRHLRMLSDALDDAVEGRMSVLVTVLAPPGVGKSRLAVAFAEAIAERATVLVGQAPAYGEGITFAPLVELLAQAGGVPTGDADEVAAALRRLLAQEDDGTAIAERLSQLLGVGEARGADVAWAVRRLLEVIARERPLAVVLEDVHWCEPPMLDLVETIAERTHGPVLFLCLARPELLELRTTWGAGNPRASTTTLPVLSDEHSRRMAGILLGDDAPPAVLDLVCATAEGNPLYLEQITAMLADQGLLVGGRWRGASEVDFEIPPTLRSLLAARLDGLAEPARQLLERASVEGRRFRLDACRALAPELESGSISEHVVALERAGLLQPEDEPRGRWRFAHPLIYEATYRGLPKGLRADLHERLAEWMAVEDADQADVDEAVARHLERTLHLRRELGTGDDAAAGVLADRAGALFAAAGLRAFAALDYITASDLLGRASSLLPELSPQRLGILPSLGDALSQAGRLVESDALLAAAVEQARTAGSEREALRASVQRLSNWIYRTPADASSASVAGAAMMEEALAAFEAFRVMDDPVGLAEAALAADDLAFVTGRMADAQHWASEALRYALAAGRPRHAILAAGDLLGIALIGPHPFDELADVGRAFVAQGEPISRTVGHGLQAAAALAAGDERSFRRHEDRWRSELELHGLTWLAAVQGMELSFMEISVGRFSDAERRLREAREFLGPIGNVWYKAIVDGFLCEAIAGQDRPDDLLRLADAWKAEVPAWDWDSRVKREVISARCQLIRGDLADAERLARRGMQLADASDIVHDQAGARRALADVLGAQGRGEEALECRRAAIERLRAKRNLAAAAYVETEIHRRA